MKSPKLTASVLLSAMALPGVAAADVEDKLKQLENEIAKIRQEAGISGDDSNVALYGTFRPVLRVLDDGEDTSLDVQDALSRWGIKADTKLGSNSRAFVLGEWKIPLNEGGALGDARLAYAGVETPFGTVTVGKQRPIQYTLIAEHVDIFNHADSPFGYNEVSPFFTDNYVTYKHGVAGVDFMAGVRANGPEGDDNADEINVGVAYSNDMFYVGASYLNVKQPLAADPLEDGDETTTIGVAGTLTIDDLYVALAYQTITDEFDNGDDDIDSTTVDLAVAYQLPNRYKVKAGLFQYENDETTPEEEITGYNLTLERQLADNVRVHAEVVSIEPEEGDTETQLNFGLRYDFEASL